MIRQNTVVALFALLSLTVFVATGDEEEEWKNRDAIAANLNPFGELCLVGDDCGSVGPIVWEGAPRGTGLSGKGVYDKYCSACHAEGLLEAPLVASDAWEPRVAQGYDVLLKHTKEGFNQLPAMGNCFDCTDEELEAAILYLITGEEETEAEEPTASDNE